MDAANLTEAEIQYYVDEGEREGEYVGEHTEDISYKFVNDPLETPETPSNVTPACYRIEDIATLETAAESLSRSGDISGAVSLWAIVLRIRQSVTDGR